MAAGDARGQIEWVACACARPNANAQMFLGSAVYWYTCAHTHSHTDSLKRMHDACRPDTIGRKNMHVRRAIYLYRNRMHLFNCNNDIWRSIDMGPQVGGRSILVFWSGSALDIVLSGTCEVHFDRGRTCGRYTLCAYLRNNRSILQSGFLRPCREQRGLLCYLCVGRRIGAKKACACASGVSGWVCVQRWV